MAFVVTDNCRGCRFTTCVSACPVACFHVGEEMVFIDPDTCIDCGACVPECPVDAIWNEKELPAHLTQWAMINRVEATFLPRLESPLAPLPEAETRRATIRATRKKRRAR